MTNKDSGSKTEKPTAHSLREARKRGEVAKSRDVGLTLGFLFALLLLWLTFGYISQRFAFLMELALNSPGLPFIDSLQTIGQEAIQTLLTITAMLIIPMALFGLLVEFFQVGPIMTLEKILPRMSHLNPAEGVKRMFSMDNLVELVKSVLQTTVLVIITVLIIGHSLDDIVDLPFSSPLAIVGAITHLALRVFGWTCLAFILMMFIDAAYQHHSFTKKMKMSLRDIKQELKDTEGDPMLKGARKQLAFEWAQEGATAAARNASVLIVNPTHVAIAVLYDQEEHQVPIMSARGEEELAFAMRSAAEHAGTPILRNERLARTLLNAETEGDTIPRELFNVVAEVILWAQSVRSQLSVNNPAILANSATDHQPQNTDSQPVPKAPGEDLTLYPPHLVY